MIQDMFRNFFAPSFALYTVLLIFFPVAAFPHEKITQSSKDSEKLFQEVYRYITARFPREEGSKAQEEVFNFVKDFAVKRGLSPVEEDLNVLVNKHSFSKNLMITIPGQSYEEFILAVPMDSVQGHGNPGINPALALLLMDYYSIHPPPLTVIFLFTAADWFHRDFPGTAAFLAAHSFSAPAVVLYLLMDEEDSLPEIYGSVPGQNTPGWFAERIRKIFIQSGMTITLDGSALLINRAGLKTKHLPLQDYLDEGIPAACLVSSGIPGSPALQKSSKWLTTFDTLIFSLKKGIPREWAKNYLYLGKGKMPLVYISERGILIICLFLFSLILIIILLQQRLIRLNIKRFRRQLWVVPLIGYLIFTLFMISTLLLEELAALKGRNNLVTESPLYFFSLKILIVLFLSSIFINGLRGLPFPVNPHFYSYLAFVTGLLNIIFVSIYSISLSPILLTSQIFIFFFARAGTKKGKQLFRILTALPQFLIFLYLFNRNYITVYGFLLTSRLWGNLFLTFLVLPLIAMSVSLKLYHHHYGKNHKEVGNALEHLFLAAAVVIMFALPFQKEESRKKGIQTILLQDKQNLDTGIREISLYSQEDIGSALLKKAEKHISITAAGREFKITEEADEAPLTLKWTCQRFLDRQSLNIVLDSPFEQKEILVEISSKEPITLYDSLFPHEMEPDQKRGRIFIGLNPPLPLHIPLVFSEESRPDIKITALRNTSDYSLETEGEKEVSRKSTIVKTLQYREWGLGELAPQ